MYALNRPALTSVALLSVALTLLLTSTVAAKSIFDDMHVYSPDESRSVVGFKGGMMTNADIYASEHIESEASMSGELFADLALGAKLYAGLAMDFHNIVTIDDQEFMIDAGVALKRAIWWKAPRLVIQPVFAVGVGRLSSLNIFHHADMLTLKAGLEVYMMIDLRKAWLFEAGMFRVPSGSTGDGGITIGPSFYLRVGYAVR